MSELSFKDEAATAYDQAVAHVSAHFLPFILRAARLEAGQRVLDVATGTGIAAEAAIAVVGAGGHVTATDNSQAMADRARQRLAGSPNASVMVDDGQALSFADGSFDAVVCSFGLMFFPDPTRSLSEFHRGPSAGRTRSGLGPHHARTLLQRADQRGHRPPRAIARRSHRPHILDR